MKVRTAFLNYVKAVSWYLLLLVSSLLLALIISQLVGYLPYSDRPGPGWQRPTFSLNEIGFFVGWALFFLLPPALIYGGAISAIAFALRALRSPLLLARIVFGAIAGLISSDLVASAGWIIAIASFTTVVGGIVGLAWGAFILPRYLRPQPEERPTIAHWTGISMILIAVTGVTYWHLFVPPYIQMTSIEVIRIVPSDKVLTVDAENSRFTENERAILKSHFAHGELESGVSAFMGISGYADARMLVVITQSTQHEGKLQIPKGSSVVYIQHGGEWLMEPASARMLRQTIRLTADEDGGTLQTPGSERADRFTWPSRISTKR